MGFDTNHAKIKSACVPLTDVALHFGMASKTVLEQFKKGLWPECIQIGYRYFLPKTTFERVKKEGRPPITPKKIGRPRKIKDGEQCQQH